MLRLIKPKFFMPIHGEYRMQKMHVKLATDCGIPEENCFIMDNGEVLALKGEEAAVAGKIPSGSVYIDGSGIGDIGNIVLRDRRILSEEGLVIVVVSINMDDFKVSAGPDLISRGFVYMRESGDLINDAQQLISNHLEKVMDRKTTQWSEIKNEITDTLAPFLYENKTPPDDPSDHYGGLKKTALVMSAVFLLQRNMLKGFDIKQTGCCHFNIRDHRKR